MMLGLIGVVRIVVALLHDWEGLDKCLVAGQVGSPRGPPPDVVLFARHRQAPDFSDVHGKQMELAIGEPSTTSGSTGLVRGHRSRPYVWAQGSVTAPRSAPVTRRAYLANTPVV
jgi:hypothetical protein